MLTRSKAKAKAKARLEGINEVILLPEEVETLFEMGDPNPQELPKALMEYSRPKINDIQSSIIRPAIAANTFEIKPGTIQMVQNTVQFGGGVTEDPNMHIRNFIEICDTFKFNGVSDDAVKLRLFPFSLRDKAKGWLHSLPAGSITTWEELAQKFLSKFFPMAKTAAIRNAIAQFAQTQGESLCEAWERYKEMLRKCPHHGMPDWMVINCFYNGLGGQSRPMVDAASGGALWAKNYEEAYDLIEMMAANEYQNPSQRLQQNKVAGVLQVDTATALTAQIEALNMKVDSLANLGMQQVASICELCAGGHDTSQCAISNESAHFVSNFQRPQHPVPNTYHPNNRNHPNFSWGNSQNNMQQSSYPPPNQQYGGRQSNTSGMQQQYAPRPQYQPPGFQQQVNEKSELEELRSMVKSQAVSLQSQASSLKTLENQIGQLANALLHRQQGSLPSNTEPNPGKRDGKEHVQAITLRSGKVTGERGIEQTSIQAEQEEIEEKEKQPINQTAKQSVPLVIDPPVYPPPPFPQRLQKQKMDQQFGKFLEVFKKLHINIPFAEALEQMPSYAKFMKGILSKKLRLADFETVALTEECSAILQQKLPPKLKDPGSFTIPCTIGNVSFNKCLCDLGASINLMPLSVFMTLGLPDPKPTNISLQLADRSVTYPRGIVEDVLVKVDKLIFPADFVILDFEEDKSIPIILGRPFLATGKTLIDVQKGELTMRVHDQNVTFNVFKAMQLPTEEEECFRLDMIRSLQHEEMNQLLNSNALVSTLQGDSDSEDEEMAECVQLLNANPYQRKINALPESLGLSELQQSQIRLKPSIEEAPELELKPLPDHLRYAFLGDASTLPVVIASNLSGSEEEKLLRILREFQVSYRVDYCRHQGHQPLLLHA